MRVIAYSSRAVSEAERRYCITRKEFLGVVFGLKKFRQHLLGRPMVVRTDHAALTHLLRTKERTKEPIGQQGRWLDLLGEFQLTIQHRPGPVHSNSDALSRRPCLRDDEIECKQCSWAIRLPEMSQSPGGASTPSVIETISGDLANPLSHLTTWLVELQSPGEGQIPSVADAVADQLTEPHSSEIVQIAEILSPDEAQTVSVAGSIVEPSVTDHTTPVSSLCVQPSSLVDVGAVEIVTVDVHAAWDVIYVII